MEVIAIFLACFFSVALGGTPWVPEPKTDNGWVSSHQRFVNNTRDNGHTVKVLFYGDSITAGWGSTGKPVFDEYYAPLGTANYGISGDRTEHVLYRIKDGEVTDRLNNTSVCVIKIGTNNMGSNDDLQIAMGIVYNVIELRERLPNMKVLLLGVLPRSNEALTNRTSTINGIVQGLDNGKTIRFLDMKDHFYVGDGIFNSDLYTGDLLHLSLAGYRKWGEVMHPVLLEMLGSS